MVYLTKITHFTDKDRCEKMYHCHIRIYFIGRSCEAFEVIKGMPALERFSHEFLGSVEPEAGLVSRADVIFACVPGAEGEAADGMAAIHAETTDGESMRNVTADDVKVHAGGGSLAEMARVLLAGKQDGAELVLLADKARVDSLAAALGEELSKIRDIWVLPMPDMEIRFRFLRWQQSFKQGKDLWEKSQFLEATINGVPNLIWYKDKEGLHEKVNDSFCKTVNKTKGQVEGRDHYFIWDVDPEEAGTDCMESDNEVMRRKETCVSEETVQSGDGVRLLTTYKSPLYDVDGSVMGTVGVGIDVTREREFENEITKKNRTLETIFMTLDCGVLCHTTDGKRIHSVNEAALKILGYKTQKEMEERGFDMIADSVMDEDKPMLKACIETLKKEGDSTSVDYRVCHDDGEILYIMGNVKLIKENGELFYQRFLMDCTEQKLQEKRNERHQMELVQAMSVDYNIVCFFNLDTGMGSVLRIDDGSLLDSVFCNASGKDVSLSESMERYIGKFVYEEDKESFRRMFSRDGLKKELEENMLYYANYRICMDGEVKYYEMKAVRTGAEGEDFGVVLGFRSVDKETRKKMEQRRILEEALQQANRANEAKSAFLSNMSHDIRTPLNAIVGFTSLALSHSDSKERVEEYLKKIMVSENHLLSLINDVLDMSRIESGKMQLEEKPCDLSEIIQGLCNIVQADVRAKKLTLNVGADFSDGKVYCDELRLNQALLNVLGNAVKYTNTGGDIRFEVVEKARTSAGSADYAFCVEDSGIGMSEEFLASIFEPFEREKNTTIGGIQGTGLGMAITKSIVEMMKGSIKVESRQGVGTKVTLFFTFRLYQEAEDLNRVHKPKGNRELDVFRTGRILLVEDNELNQEIALAILGDAGLTVELATNGQIAVEMVKNSKPGYYQLILMDVQMPVMNGYEATREIRKLENKELASIPILAMTANAFEEDKKEALKNGMNGHISKPVDVEKLFETLGEILEK